MAKKVAGTTVVNDEAALLGGAGVVLPGGDVVALGGGLVLPEGDGPGVGGDGGLA